MKLRSLLLAASAVALSATAANALELKDLGGDSGVVLSDELDLTTNVEGTYDFTITRDGGSADFVPGNTVVTIRLPTGRVLTEDLSTSMGVSLLGSDGSVGTPRANAVNATTAVFDITISGDNALILTGLPVGATADVGANELEIDVQDPSATLTEPGFTDDTVFVTSESSFDNYLVVADMQPTIANNSSLSDGVLGTILLAENSTDTAIALDPTQAFFDVTSDVSSVDIVLGFTDVTGIASATISSGATADVVSGTIDVPNNEIDFNVTGLAWLFDSTPDTFTIVGEDDDMVSIATQTPTVASVNANITDANADLNDGPFALAVPAADDANTPADETNEDLDEILISAPQAAENFVWVGETGTLSVMRVTGLPASTPVDYEVTFSNVVGAAASDGAFEATATTNAAGELALVSRNAFGTTNVGFVRADVSFVFDAPSAPDIDRQLFRASGSVGTFAGTENEN